MKNRRFSEQERLDRRRLLAAGGAALLVAILGFVDAGLVRMEVPYVY
jgi:hypothetical protein